MAFVLFSYSSISLAADKTDVDDIPGPTSASLAPYCTSITFALLVPEPWEDGLPVACDWRSNAAELCVGISFEMASPLMFLSWLAVDLTSLSIR